MNLKNALINLFIYALSLFPFNLPNIQNEIKMWNGVDENYDNEFTDIEEINNSLIIGNSCMANYFVNLRNNFGNNSDTSSTCGYVALGMLLNYYDTMYDDNIVLEQYEANSTYDSINFDHSTCESPGTVYEESYTYNYDPNHPEDDNQVKGYLTYLRENYIDTSLHAYLVLLGTDSLSSNNQSLASTYRGAFGTNECSLYDTIVDYFNQLSYTNYSVSMCTSMSDNVSVSDVVNFIDVNLYAGHPVLVGFGGHARIIFGKSSAFYYSHEGYRNSNGVTTSINVANLMAPDINPSDSIGAISLRINTTQSYSYHYHSSIYNDDCNYLGNYINHNSHTYVDHYTNYSSNYHRAYCKCGEYRNVRHDYFSYGDHSGRYCICGKENPNYGII